MITKSNILIGVGASENEKRTSVGSVEDDVELLKERHQAEMSERSEQIERLSQQLMDKMQLWQQVQFYAVFFYQFQNWVVCTNQCKS